MEIPYVVTPRKDTGLFNSKIAIWLFLASEVMLFGGFFSAYVFLRLGADYPWPERTLPVLPGLINTFVLIGSSVTVVFAWASLKMRQWRRFQFFMGITVTCAVVFMALKGVEYSVKLKHQALRLNDYSIVEGHLAYELKDGVEAHHGEQPKADDYALNHKGKKIEENQIYVETSKLTFDLRRFYQPWIEEINNQVGHRDAKIVLAQDVTAVTQEKQAPETLAKAGEPLSVDLLKKIRKAHLAAAAHNSRLRTAALRKEWKTAKAAHPGEADWKYASSVNIDTKALEPLLLTEIPSVAFNVDPPARLEFRPRDIQEAAGKSTLRDGTVVEGALQASPMGFHYVDAIDFQYLVMKAVEKGIDPEIAIEESWLYKNHQFVRDAWTWHRGEIEKLKARLLKGYGTDKDGKPKREPTHKELYRMGWEDFARMAEDNGRAKLSGMDALGEHFFGPDYDARGNETFPHLVVPREQVGFSAKFSPAWNTYYAIYFIITGLHGIHVIGGALVLAYYLFFGRKMYLSNPEWLANRVEIGGLFWHFVDLIWIFAFPILYLM